MAAESMHVKAGFAGSSMSRHGHAASMVRLETAGKRAWNHAVPDRQPPVAFHSPAPSAASPASMVTVSSFEASSSRRELSRRVLSLPRVAEPTQPLWAPRRIRRHHGDLEGSVAVQSYRWADEEIVRWKPSEMGPRFVEAADLFNSGQFYA